VGWPLKDVSSDGRAEAVGRLYQLEVLSGRDVDVERPIEKETSFIRDSE
jgi:hypothetical protein